jgi:serine/threonine-protein kinase
MIGKTISHYKIIEKLGSGGMGIVYKAHDTKLNRFVALKFLPPHLTEDDSTRKRFIVEARSASALDHPNICTIHEINDTPDGQLYICMAYYEGESLRDKIDNGPISFEESLKIFSQIALGLKAAHEQNIIHRDIKPGNIFITDKGEVKIVDFGLAKIAGMELTKSTNSKGTAAYMCPEQICGEKVDQRCDIWALGVVLYEMLTGHLPFTGDYPEPMMYAIVHEEPKPLSLFLDNVSEPLQNIILKLLEKDPNDRYSDIDKVLGDFQIFIKADDSDLITKRSIPRRWVRRKTVYASISILIIILFIYLFRSTFLFHSSDGKKIAVLPVDIMTTDTTDQDWFYEGITEELIVKLAQISGLRVISRSSSMLFKGTTKTALQIASELDVQYLVETSSAKTGEQVKINAKLIDAVKDEYIWAKEYESSIRNIIELQAHIAKEIATQIQVKLTPQEISRFNQTRKVDPRAYELYLKGFYQINNLQTLKPSTYNYFVKAISIDSNYALAYVGMGLCYGLYTYHSMVPREEGISKIREYINKALEIDENLAEAYHLEGAFKFWQLWDWEGAGKAFNRAMTINPNVAGLFKGEYLWYLMALGHFKEAIYEAERLLDLDPLALVTRKATINVYYYARQYEKAIELCKRTIELNPDHKDTFWRIARIYEQLGLHDDAYKNRLKAMRLSETKPQRIAEFDSLYKELGSKAYPNWQLMNDDSWYKNNPTTVAGCYTQLADLNKAMYWLEKAFKVRDGELALLYANPKWDPLRGQSEFQNLLKRMNFPD